MTQISRQLPPAHIYEPAKKKWGVDFNPSDEAMIREAHTFLPVDLEDRELFMVLLETFVTQKDKQIEEAYNRGVIDQKVEDLGKTRTHRPTDKQKIEYQQKLLDALTPPTK